MCGLIGIVGKDLDSKELLNMMQRIEYRGYDSMGMALVNQQNQIKINKVIGNKLSIENDKYKLALGHCRWATHGSVSIQNTHPHHVRDTYIVHNGILDNFNQLKQSANHKWNSETDSEYLAYIIGNRIYKEKIHDCNILNSIIYILQNVSGRFAFACLVNNKIYAASKGMELFLIKNNTSIAFSSDSSVIQGQFIPIKGYGILHSHDLSYQIYDYNHQELSVENNMIENKINNISQCKNITLHELYESYDIAKQLLRKKYDIVEYQKYNFPIATACGSSYFICLLIEYYSKYHIRALIPSQIEKYHPDYIFTVSQSGETADLLCAIQNRKIDSIVNREHSTLDIQSNISYYCQCGYEKGVAATKSVIAQAIIANILFNSQINEKQILHNINKALNMNIDHIISQLYRSDKIIILGDHEYHPVALEGALKCTELLYIPVLAIYTSEFKHGYLSLIDENATVLLISKNDNVATQISARGGNVMHLYQDIQNEIGMIVLVQRIAIELCLKRKLNLDKPRNLAKSITVL